MITAIVLGLQLGVAATPITVRTADRAVSLAVVTAAERVGVRADALAGALRGTVSRAPGGRYKLSVGGIAIELEPGLSFAWVGGATVPLATPPWMEGAALYIPAQVVTELVPRFGTGLSYDPGTRELRTVSAALAGAASATSPPVLTSAGTGGPPHAAADASRVAEPQPAVARRANVRRVVVLDAGHGGRDPGGGGVLACQGRRVYEKDVTLAVAKLMAEELRRAGMTVIMTRTTDTLIGLYDRGPIANRAKGDLFVSLHVNAAPNTWRNPSAGRGFETYFLAEAKTDDARRVEQMENSAIRFETEAQAPKGDPLSFIITDMAQNEHLRESMDLAESIQQGMRRVHPGPNRGVKQANFVVLRTAFMPAVLVELGFATNPQDAAYMCSASGQRQLAAAVAAGAVEYLSNYEQRLGNGR